MNRQVLALLVTLLTLPAANPKALAQTPEQISPISPTRSFRQILRRLFPDDESKDPPTISRGELCLLSPARPGQEIVIWHQTPVFIWQGEIGKMNLIDDRTNTIIWTYEPATGESSKGKNHIQYDGEPLLANRLYRWQVFETIASDSPILFPPFRVLPKINRLLIANGLSVAERRAGTDTDNDESNNLQALARADYFISRRLPVDALQSLFLVTDPSPDFVAARQAVVDSLCD